MDSMDILMQGVPQILFVFNNEVICPIFSISEL